MRGQRIAQTRKASGFRSRGTRRVRCAVHESEQTLATGLPGYTQARGEVIRCRACNTFFAHTAVAVAIKHAGSVVHRNLVEVEQVAIVMAAALLPDTSHTLNGIIRRGIYGRPGRTAVIGRGYEHIPLARKTIGLIVTVYVRAKKTYRCTARAAANRLDFHSVLHAVKCAKVEIIGPSHTVIVTDLYVSMTLGRIARRDRLVVHVGVVNCAIRVDGDRRIGAFRLRDAAVNDELLPGHARIRADGATLRTATMIDRQPHTAIRSNANVTVQTMALGDTVALVCQHARTVTVAERITALTSGRSHYGLRATLDSRTLMALIPKRISHSLH